MTDPLARAEETHAAVARSAAATAGAAERNTQLAVDRTLLAAERTYAAWVRTGLTALAAGIGAKALLHEVVARALATLAGMTLELFAGFCFVAAVWRELLPLQTPLPADYRRLPPAVLIGVNGVLLLVSLAALAGVATAR